jgi:hypothetical protein
MDIKHKDCKITDIKLDSHVQIDWVKNEYKSDFKYTDVKVNDMRKDKPIKEFQI